LSIKASIDAAAEAAPAASACWVKAISDPPLVACTHPAALRCIGRQEQSVRKRMLPMPGQGNQIGAVGTVSVKKEDDLLGTAAGQWLQAGAIYNLGQFYSA
jgi:hypothetical protein